jgi:metal-responsive CopG/Arc/MetJ family transcriptional regulator
MRTALSLPDDLFERAERYARRIGKSRSQLFSDALREYLARHSPDEITEAMDRMLDEGDAPEDDFHKRATRSLLERVDW